MSFITRILNLETRAALTDRQGWLVDWVQQGMGTASGESVGPVAAMGVSAYYGAIRAISEDVAKLPLPVIAKRGKTRTPKPEHPLHKLLNTEPNPNMGAMSWRETMTHYALAWGGAIAEVVRDGSGSALGIGQPISPERVRIEEDSSGLIYIIRPSDTGPEVTLPAERIFHLHGLGSDGITGYSVAQFARQTLGLALASEKSGASFFGNRSMPGGVLETTETLGDDGRQNLKRSWDAAHSGAENAYATAVLEQGVSFKPISIPATDAQWIESRHFGVEEIARWFRIPPHKIGHLLRSTFSNIEQQSIEYVVDTLLPWLKRWEQEIQRKLIKPSDKNIFAEHNVNGLLRGDTESRFKAYSTGRQWGWLSANDIRDLENQSPVKGGDVYLAPSNMVPAEKLGEDPPAPVMPAVPPPAEDEDAPDEDRTAALGEIHIPLIAEAIRKMVELEQDRSTRAAKRDDLAGWADKFYEDFADKSVPALMRPVGTFVRSVWAANTDKPFPAAMEGELPLFVKVVAGKHGTTSRHTLETDGALPTDGRPECEARDAMITLSAWVRGRLTQ